MVLIVADLAEFTSAELIAELELRGYTVTAPVTVEPAPEPIKS